MNTYLLDTNVFISAQNKYYDINFCPGFWDWLILHNEKGRLYSIDRVLNELSNVHDDLYNWSNLRGDQFFQSTHNLELREKVREVYHWLSGNQFSSNAIRKFNRGADLWLIAYASLHSQTIVTHEKFVSSKEKIKIPVICEGMGVPVVDTFEMLRTESPEFVLKNKKLCGYINV